MTYSHSLGNFRPTSWLTPLSWPFVFSAMTFSSPKVSSLRMSPVFQWLWPWPLQWPPLRPVLCCHWCGHFSGFFCGPMPVASTMSSLVDTSMTHSHNHLHDCGSVHGPHWSSLHGQGQGPLRGSVHCQGCRTMGPHLGHGCNKCQCLSEKEEYPSKREMCRYFQRLIFFSHFTTYLVD